MLRSAPACQHGGAGFVPCLGHVEDRDKERKEELEESGGSRREQQRKKKNMHEEESTKTSEDTRLGSLGLLQENSSGRSEAGGDAVVLTVADHSGDTSSCW